MSPAYPPTHGSSSTIEAPDWLLVALEGRALWELAASILAAPVLAGAPKGDGHPVMVFPGLATDDMATLMLRSFLANRGYATHAWEQGLNLGPRPGVLDGCVASVRRLRATYGRPVSLVGWSLGGLYAREIAHRVPDDVRTVITLGSPIVRISKATNAWWLYQLASGDRVAWEPRLEDQRSTPPVPTTSIFSRTDGVVAWQCSVERETEYSENIEIHASHLGMGMNPMALYAIADRLAQREGDWRRFDRGLGAIARLLYRDPRGSHRYGQV